MGTLFLIVTLLVVVGILLAVLGGLLEMSPLGRHSESYRDRSGRRIGSAPRLD
jgi:hypothetical protein